jgi:hypothetical protein
LERDERRDDDGRTVELESRELVDRGLAAARRQERQGVASRRHRRDGFGLTRQEPLVPERLAGGAPNVGS